MSKRIIDQLKQRRQELGITQAELADKLGVKQPRIARIEAHDNEPSLAQVEAIANTLGCTLLVRRKKITDK